MDRGDTPTTIFVHVPKTAGTSLVAMLRQEHGRSAVWGMYGEERDALVEQYLALPANERAQIRAITGHVEFGVHRFVAGPVRYVTMLRDPIDRVVSHYHYARRVTSEEWARRALEGVVSLDDYVTRSPDAPKFNNAHVRFLGGDLRESELPPTRHMLDCAKRNLERFAVVGLQERFDESVLLMRRALGWGWPSLRQHNVTAERPHVGTLDAHTRDLIAEHNALDLELYAFGRECFERQLAAYGPGLHEDLATLRGARTATVTDDGLHLSVVVMGYGNEATIVEAARSLLAQATQNSAKGERMEVIAVVSGDDRSAELLHEHFSDLHVVDSPTRLLPGGARNAGITHTRGEIVAFLAGDCIAAPGWAAARIASHRAGHEVVAGAMDVAQGAGPVALAELVLLYSARLARGPAGPASHPQAHGLSFTRRVLNEIGPFREDVRIGEDTLASHRLHANGIPVWFDPAIVAEHVGPATFRAFLRDQHARGRRESEWDSMQGGFPRRWFDALPGFSVVLRASKRFFARLRWILAGAWRASRGHRWHLVTAMPALLVGLMARQRGWMADQRRSLRRPVPE